MSRRIAIVTSGRADYGLLCPLLRQVRDEPDLELQLLVTGMHLSRRFGNTIEQILDDGFEIAGRIDLGLDDDSPKGIAHAMSQALVGFEAAYEKLQPAIVIVLGDRFEIMAAAQAAMICRVPLGHIHGGEASEGAMDEAIRHCITKMAHLHFTAAEPYRRRVIQLGEDPERVFNVGALAVANVNQTTFLDRLQLEAGLGGFRFGETNLLVTYHPVTLDDKQSETGMRNLLDALDRFPETHVLFTRPNADQGGRRLDEMLDAYIDRNPGRCAAFAALGAQRYLSVVKLVDAVVGNSSSGLIEVPVVGKPSVNIGDRQRGRLRPASVIDTSIHAADIERGIREALSTDFQSNTVVGSHPFGEGDAAERISVVLKEFDLDTVLIKRFHKVLKNDE